MYLFKAPLTAIQRFFALTSVERQLLIEAIFTLFLVRIGLWVLPFRLVQRGLEISTKNVAQVREAKPRMPAPRFTWAVEAASRFVPAATCLSRALVARRLLTKNGHPAEIKIGVRKNSEGQLDAHAWIESEGRIVIGDLDELNRYTVLPPFTS